MPLVRCRIHTHGEPEELWVDLNRSTRKISGSEWMYVWFYGRKKFVEAKLPSQYAKNIKLCIEMMGSVAGVEYLVEKGVSPDVGKTAQSAWKAFRDTGFKDDGKLLSTERVTRWVVDHGLQQAIKAIQECNLWHRRNHESLWYKCRDNQSFHQKDFVPRDDL
jgi:hypothetical protein